MHTVQRADRILFRLDAAGKRDDALARIAPGLRLRVIGLVTGIAASFGLTRLLQAQVFNVKPADPATLTGVALFIAVE